MRARRDLATALLAWRWHPRSHRLADAAAPRRARRCARAAARARLRRRACRCSRASATAPTPRRAASSRRAARSAVARRARCHRASARPRPQRGDADPAARTACSSTSTRPALGDGARGRSWSTSTAAPIPTARAAVPLYDGAALCPRGDVVVVTLNHRLNAFGYLYLGRARCADLRRSRQRRPARPGPGAAVGARTCRGIRRRSRQRHRVRPVRRRRQDRHADGHAGRAGPVPPRRHHERPAGHRLRPACGAQRTHAVPATRSVRATRRRAAQLAGRPRWSRPRARAIPSRVEDGLYFGPVLDERSLPRHPFYPDAPAQSAAIPMIIGNTHDETRAFLGGDPANFTPRLGRAAGSLRSASSTSTSIRRGDRRVPPPLSRTTRRARCSSPPPPPAAPGAARLEAEARARQGAPTWAYQLDWCLAAGRRRRSARRTRSTSRWCSTPRRARLAHRRRAAAHDACADAHERCLARLCAQRRPQPRRRLPAWAPYSLPRRETMVFDAAAGACGRSARRRARALRAGAVRPARDVLRRPQGTLASVASGTRVTAMSSLLTA